MYNPLELRDDLKAKRTEDDRDPFGRIRPEPAPEPEISNLGDPSKLARPVGEKGRNDRRDVAKVAKLPAGHPPYALPDDVFAENQRMARALAKRRGIGDFDRFTTDAINTDGAKAVYEVGDLIKQVRRHDPAQTDELLAKTRQGIAPANIRLLAAVAAADADGKQMPEADAADPLRIKQRAWNESATDFGDVPYAGDFGPDA